MSEPKIAREVADAEVAAWEEQFDVVLDADAREKITRAYMSGRLSFDSASEAFTLTLRRPVMFDNGGSLAVLTIKEPTSGQLQQAHKIKDEMEMTMRLFSSLSGQPVNIIERIGSKDITTAGALLDFFG